MAIGFNMLNDDMYGSNEGWDHSETVAHEATKELKEAKELLKKAYGLLYVSGPKSKALKERINNFLNK